MSLCCEYITNVPILVCDCDKTADFTSHMQLVMVRVRENECMWRVLILMFRM